MIEKEAFEFLVNKKYVGNSILVVFLIIYCILKIIINIINFFFASLK